CAIYSKDEAYW
nr:immunoglobulin heavy chain junction region [Mus musculus]MBK4197470.1 immunoglobulin heavy chain junction region [Mus musculus]